MKKFNMQMNIAKAIGITAVVAGHVNWQIFGEFFQSYSWHMAFFFFVSGYFFNIDKKFTEHLKKSFIKYFGWLYGYHFFYGIVTFAVFILFDRLYGKIPSLKNLTICVFDAIHFDFDIPLWFLSCLAVSLVIFALVMSLCRKISKNSFVPAIIFIPLGICAVFLSKPDYQPAHGLTRVLVRTFFAMYYIYAGWIYKNEFEKFIKFNTKWLIAVLVLQTILIQSFFNNFVMDINTAKFFHNITPLIIPFTGIYFVLFISKLLVPLVKEGSFIDKAGRNTLHIMANHLFIIFLTELAIFLIDKKEFNLLPTALIHNFYNQDKYKFLYTFVSLGICTYLGEWISYGINYLKDKGTLLKKRIMQKFCTTG